MREIRFSELKVAMIVPLVVLLSFAHAQEDAASFDSAEYILGVLTLMETNWIRRDSVDWADLRDEVSRVAARIASNEEAHSYLSDVIDRLGDNHSHIIPPARVADLQARTPSAIAYTTPSSYVISPELSYVFVPRFSSVNQDVISKYVDDLEVAIRAADSSTTCGWIVDLRENVGGNVYPMYAGLGPLLGNGSVGGGINADGSAYSVWYRDGSAGINDTPLVSGSGEPYLLENRSPAIAVLIGPKTMSSGEAIALAFIGRERARIFGQPSGGRTTGNAAYSLPDGAMLALSMSVMTDYVGRRYGGPIEPDVAVDDVAASAARLEDQPVVRSAIEWLHAADDCPRVH